MSLPAQQSRRATYADLEALPSNVVGEILDGELFASPRPASPHALAASMALSDLGSPFNRGGGGPTNPGGWWILIEPELHLDEDVVVPDLAGWRRERMPVMPNVAGFTLAPDWVCEVQSPSTARIDRVQKRTIYARSGVASLWMIDPLARTLEVQALQDGRWVLVGAYADTARVRAVPFEALEIDLANWWLPQAPSP